jgi:hypothetical protein
MFSRCECRGIEGVRMGVAAAILVMALVGFRHRYLQMALSAHTSGLIGPLVYT